MPITFIENNKGTSYYLMISASACAVLEALAKKAFKGEHFGIPNEKIKIHSFTVPKDAIAFFNNNRSDIDLVITDMNMTEEYNGIYVTKIVSSPNIVTALYSADVLSANDYFSFILEKPTSPRSVNKLLTSFPHIRDREEIKFDNIILQQKKLR